MIEVHDLRKVRGSRVAVDGISFATRPGRITAFLGPNGSGKTTTFRVVAGLDHPTSGRVLVSGRPPREWAQPAATLGAVVDGPALHPSWSVEDHLRVVASMHGIGGPRVAEVVEGFGLSSFARLRGRELSLGMRQRVALALAMLGAPGTLLLDEPTNGLDPASVRWLRELLREHVREGGHVLLSTHLMHEVAELADDLVLIDRGRIVSSSTVEEFVAERSAPCAVVDGPDRTGLRRVLARHGHAVGTDRRGLVVRGVTAAEVGRAAFLGGCEVSRLEAVVPSLEELYLSCVGGGDVGPGPAGRLEGAA